MKRLKGKRAVITGAGSGLGREIAVKLAQENWDILISDIKLEKADETLQMVQSAGGKGLVIQCDVRNIDSIRNLASTAFKKWDAVDLLVNNAGVTCTGYIEGTPIENWKWIADTNLWGVLYGCHAFLPRMKQQGWGHIVNVASIAGIISLPEMGAYNMTKAAVISLSETLRSELSPSNIGVTVVCPTMFSSNLFESLRYETEQQQQIAEYLFKTASMDAARVAEHVLKAVRTNRFYVLPQLDARFGWFAKRFFPRLYFKTISLCYTYGFKKLLVKKARSCLSR